MSKRKDQTPDRTGPDDGHYLLVLQVVAVLSVRPLHHHAGLAPILIGAALYGPKACLGGYSVPSYCWPAFGLGPGGAILWNANPFLTALVCLGSKASWPVWLPAWSIGPSPGRQIPQQRSYAGRSIAAGIVSPVVNTGSLFCWVCFSCSRPIWRHGPPVLGRRLLLI